MQPQSIRRPRRRHSNTPALPIPALLSGDDLDSPNEAAPLLQTQQSDGLTHLPPAPAPDPGENNEDTANAQPPQIPESKSRWYMILLTISILGLQIAWSIEMSSGSPYLLSLGLTKDALAFVWIAGPLSGVLVQPYVGAKSDRCTSRFGRRRPFMVGGAVATVVSLLALAWAKEISDTLFATASPATLKLGTLVWASIMIYVLDFSINVIQAAIRAFIVDNAPTHQQDSANAWATRLSGVGNILGFLFGFMDLPKRFGFFGDTQLKVLCMLGSLILVLTVTISCISIDEAPGQLTAPQDGQQQGLFAFFKELRTSIRHLPPQIRAVCWVQFFAWIGWFPFLFYITIYISEIYASPRFAVNPHMTDEEIDRVWEEGTRVGTGALFISAITSFVAIVVLPILVTSSWKSADEEGRRLSGNTTVGEESPQSATKHSDATTVSSGLPRMFFRYVYPNDRPEPSCLALESFQIPWLTLRRAWLVSHIFTALLFWSTFFVSTTTGAIWIVELLGIPWAITLWAPFALIAAEISRGHDNLRDPLRSPPIEPGRSERDHNEQELGETIHGGHTYACPEAGVVLGIHNVAIAAPQVIATMVSWAIFRQMEKPRGSVGDESVAWVLRFGGVCACVAAWLTRRVTEEGV